ncbi:YtxH domain-containing protein [Pedobacter deserti]|uniref:YtxH domain-containing protein n=1 Tax=Pedobacter deserti TaxID=2817382 RepID=UPI00210BBD1B|nr:YtxH domain-containing protein [Pedobacter sp. SYSU D00382]
MNYKKLINSHLSKSTCSTSTAVVGLVAGLAVGAALGILFAPDKGSATRERLTDRALGLADDVKDGLHSLKDTISTGKDSLVGLKDDVIEKVKTRASNISQEYKDFRESELNKSAATDADTGQA